MLVNNRKQIQILALQENLRSYLIIEGVPLAPSLFRNDCRKVKERKEEDALRG